MKIRDLSIWESFYWVAKESNFARAAERLKIGPSFLSKRIVTLEDTLGVRLFQRTTRKVSLTDEGRSLFVEVESFLEDAHGLEDRFSRQDIVSGTIRLSCVTAFAHRVLAPVIIRFMTKYPAIVFELQTTDVRLDLIDNRLDLAIRVQEPVGADFVFKKLVQNRLVACAAPQYIKNCKGKILRPEDLRQHRLFTLDVYKNCGFKKSTVKIGELGNAQSLRCDNGLLLTEMARLGGGVAIRSLWDVNNLLKSGELQRILPQFPIDAFGDFYAVIPTRRLLAPRVRHFIDFLAEEATTWDFG